MITTNAAAPRFPSHGRGCRMGAPIFFLALFGIYAVAGGAPPIQEQVVSGPPTLEATAEAPMSKEVQDTIYRILTSSDDEIFDYNENTTETSLTSTYDFLTATVNRAPEMVDGSNNNAKSNALTGLRMSMARLTDRLENKREIVPKFGETETSRFTFISHLLQGSPTVQMFITCQYAGKFTKFMNIQLSYDDDAKKWVCKVKKAFARFKKKFEKVRSLHLTCKRCRFQASEKYHGILTLRKKTSFSWRQKFKHVFTSWRSKGRAKIQRLKEEAERNSPTISVDKVVFDKAREARFDKAIPKGFFGQYKLFFDDL